MTATTASRPFYALLGLIWLMGATGGAMMLWASQLLPMLHQSLSNSVERFSMPVELAVRQGHASAWVAPHPGFLAFGLLLAVGSMALAVVLAQHHDHQL